jgi:hypothetical protein
LTLTLAAAFAASPSSAHYFVAARALALTFGGLLLWSSFASASRGVRRGPAGDARNLGLALVATSILGASRSRRLAPPAAQSPIGFLRGHGSDPVQRDEARDDTSPGTRRGHRRRADRLHPNAVSIS